MALFWRTNPPHESPVARLLRMGEFSPSDLAANRTGILTEAQQRVMRQRALWELFQSVLFMALILFALLYTYRPEYQIFFVILVFVSVWILFGQYRNFQDYKHRTVKMIQGAVKLRRSRSQHYIEVSNRKSSFRVSRRIQKAFIEGETYICYYAASSKALVAAEHIPAP
jgi:hypothetical protein